MEISLINAESLVLVLYLISKNNSVSNVSVSIEVKSTVLDTVFVSISIVFLIYTNY